MFSSINNLDEFGYPLKVRNINGLPSAGWVFNGPDPVFYLPLDAYATIAPTGQTLTYSSAPTYTTINGVMCALFNGSKNIVTTENSGISGTTPRTVSFWSLPTGTAAYATAVGFGQEGSTGSIWMSGTKLSGSNINIEWANWGNDISVASGATNDGKLHHFCFVYDGSSSLQMYVDGYLLTTYSRSDSVVNAPVYVGGDSYMYTGYLAGVRIWSTTLTADQVLQLSTEFGG